MVKRPGAFRIEEVDLSGPPPIEGVETSVCGFLGTAERGPLSLSGVNEPGEYRRIYGGGVTGSSLFEVVKGFFANGGERCYVARVAGAGAVPATARLGPEGRLLPPPSRRGRSFRHDSPVLRITALGPGRWGNRVRIWVDDDVVPERRDALNITVHYRTRRRTPAPAKRPYRTSSEAQGNPDDVHESFQGLSPDPSSREFFIRVINRDSALIRMEGDPLPVLDLTVPVTLGGGRDGHSPALPDYLGDPGAAPDRRTGLAALSGEDEISLITSPDMHLVAGLPEVLALSCEEQGDRFAILHMGPSPLEGNPCLLPCTSSYAALYHPWIVVKKERGPRGSPVPPCGHIAGAYARVDRTQGVHRPPVGESLEGVVDLAVHLGRDEENALNGRGVNTIRAFPGGRFYIWGSRTLDPAGVRSIGVRRLLIQLEQSISRGIRWAVHEPEASGILEILLISIREFLGRAWSEGALKGTREEEAFFVSAGRGDDRGGGGAGAFPLTVGVAPERPGEFILFSIVRESSRFTVRESLVR
jgi:hypothetical protein